MKLVLDINRITEEQARSGETTWWGTCLEDADNFAWQAPMLGDGGCSPTVDLAQYLARYVGCEDHTDIVDGPDECVFVEDGVAAVGDACSGGDGFRLDVLGACDGGGDRWYGCGGVYLCGVDVGARCWCDCW